MYPQPRKGATVPVVKAKQARTHHQSAIVMDLADLEHQAARILSDARAEAARLRESSKRDAAAEAVLIKLHDSDHSVAWRAPHTAFHDAGTAGAHPRESVEFRTIAFFD
jgi:hypothetical protein